MPRAFHIDRLGQLQAGQELAPAKPMPVLPGGEIDLAAMAFTDDRFPGGLTMFGREYLIGRNFLTGTDDTGQETDLIFELVRRLGFPNRTSRYTAFFASQTLCEAVAFRDKYGGGVGIIWDVEFDVEPFRADYEHLDLSGTPLDVWMRAERYWRGEASPAPCWELILSAPVRVLGIARAAHLTD